jgi:multidrug efflux pump subunit AcrB
LPPGIEPPIVVQYNASSVPVLRISLSSNTLNEQQLYDYGLYNLRQRLAPIEPGDQVVLTPPVNLGDGDKVHVRRPAAAS